MVDISEIINNIEIWRT